MPVFILRYLKNVMMKNLSIIVVYHAATSAEMREAPRVHSPRTFLYGIPKDRHRCLSSSFFHVPFSIPPLRKTSIMDSRQFHNMRCSAVIFNKL